MTAPVLLVAGVGVAIVIGSVVSRGSSRIPWLALAVASVPLTSLLWWNVGQVGHLVAGAAAAPPSLAQLDLKFGRLFAAGLLPALAAWAIMWQTPDAEGRPCPRLCLQPWQRAGRTAAATLGLVVAGGIVLVSLQDMAGQRTAIGNGHWAAVDPWLVLGLSTTGAVVEELLFRGVLYAFLARYVGFAWGAVLQAVAFGAIHIGYLDPWYVVGAFAFGLFQAFASVRWGLVAAIAVHAQINVVILAWSGRATVQANEVLVLGTVAFNVATVAIFWWATRRAKSSANAALVNPPPASGSSTPASHHPRPHTQP